MFLLFVIPIFNIDKVKFTYSHSSGPGGQNVNNVATKVEVRFKVADADWLPEIIRNNLITKVYLKRSSTHQSLNYKL